MIVGTDVGTFIVCIVTVGSSPTYVHLFSPPNLIVAFQPTISGGSLTLQVTATSSQATIFTRISIYNFNNSKTVTELPILYDKWPDP